ncbi:alpha/beta hydrolase [Parafilimonas terrae]|uniref:Acetyl esterase/lipase n=1 Tax=Parafilimonas terrae TaxID=1465490 RepID=A0A1I5Z7S2_9BACT|nr:alpha/beta hydrolase [Parafilimonas terrae]SFQ52510.1 Acetyl esterase/lipase [Parafilimonas terrae]
MKYYLYCFISFFITTACSGQNTPVLYKDISFNKVNIQKNIVYSFADSIKEKYRCLDFYQPATNSALQKSPLIIWMHGGGFKFGTKNAAEIKLWGDEFAKRGYAFAAINYRLSKKNPLFKFKDLVEACYDNVEDVNNAITFFKANASRFNIDTGKIILGGNSAGAVIALQTVYSNSADIKYILDSNKTVANTNNNYNTQKVAAIINFWGALFNKDWLLRAKVPIVSVHGSKDRIVPVNNKGVVFFGSQSIHEKADSLHIPNSIKVYEGYAHELHKHFNPLVYPRKVKQRHKEAAQFACDFLYNFFKGE